MRTELDIAYVEDADTKQRLDLYLPEAEGFPVVLFVHGGSLRSGDRKDAPHADICRSFVADGIGCAATSYRLFPQVTWPAPAEDVAAAFVWLRGNIDERGGDPERIVLLGHSSGCLLATLVSSDGEYLKRHGRSPRDVFAVLAMGCRLNDRQPDPTGRSAEEIRRFFEEHPDGKHFRNLDVMRRFYPMNFVGPQMPPFVALIAEAERFKPPILTDASLYVGIARDCGIDADLVILPGATHRTSMQNLARPDDPTRALILGFIDRLTRVGPAKHQADPDNCPARGGGD